MGKHGKRGGGGRGRRPASNARTQRPNGASWNDFDTESMKNKSFEEYYKAQNIVPEAEWEDFLNILRTELPTTFRVTGSREHADTINGLIKDVYVPTMQEVELEGVKYAAPKPIEWYPNQFAWEVSAPKRVVRKQPAFKTFQRFLVGETSVGNLSRQEAVSMIPPLLMDVEPHHYCLDMCAAPGSKTTQIIEALNPYHTESTGMLIANDSDYKRTHMLVHQTGGRMPTKGLIVTNLDATMIPNISLGDGETLKFDRILADVPCSGDGTMRKNLEIWSKWSPYDGASLHVIQLRILDRAMAMLKPGGRLVYSTCSFNPTENEAVVAAALNAHPGEFHIVDVADKLPALKRRPGINSWRVFSRPNDELVEHASFKEYRTAVDASAEREQDKLKGMPETCWPPANAAELNLERCLRLLPHDQNTGGFYVCVLEKKAAPEAPAANATKVEKVDIASLPTPDEVIAIDEKGSLPLKRAASPSAEAAAAPKKLRSEATKKEKRDLQFREDPFSFVDPTHAEIDVLKEWFQLQATFPENNLLVRNEYGNPLRTMYIVNDTIKKIVLNNDYTRLRMISAGVKTFIRQDSQQRTDIKCKWRVSADGISEILQHVPTESVKVARVDELRTFLEDMYPPIDKFEEPFKTDLVKADLGNMLVKFEAGEAQGGKLTLPLYLPVWKAKHSMSLLVDKQEKSVLSERTFGEDICKPAPKSTLPGGTPALPSGAVTPVEGTATPAEGTETPVENPVVDEEAALNA